MKIIKAIPESIIISFNLQDAKDIIKSIDMAENEGVWSISAEKLKGVLRNMKGMKE